MFKDGYLYKYVSLKTIDAKGIEPSLDELQRFQKPGDDGMDTLGLPPSAVKNRAQFMKGDAVVVVEGDLRNVMGVVEKVDDGIVYVVPKNSDLKVSLPCLSLDSHNLILYIRMCARFDFLFLYLFFSRFSK